jgi:hypothetical protein
MHILQWPRNFDPGGEEDGTRHHADQRQLLILQRGVAETPTN